MLTKNNIEFKKLIETNETPRMSINFIDKWKFFVFSMKGKTDKARMNQAPALQLFLTFNKFLKTTKNDIKY